MTFDKARDKLIEVVIRNKRIIIKNLEEASRDFELIENLYAEYKECQMAADILLQIETEGTENRKKE